MVECYVQASVAFNCCAFEAALLEEAFRAAQDWDEQGVTFDPSARFQEVFPPASASAPWSGLQAIFGNPDYPTFGAKILVKEIADLARLRLVIIHSRRNFAVDAISELIRICCRTSLMVRPIGFEYAMSCSRPLPGQFGGGWCIIRADGVERGSTYDMLAAAMGAGA